MSDHIGPLRAGTVARVWAGVGESLTNSVIDEVLPRAPKILPLGRAAPQSSLLLRARGIALVAAILRTAATETR
jgi:hypothetical protein